MEITNEVRNAIKFEIIENVLADTSLSQYQKYDLIVAIVGGKKDAE